MFWNFNFESPSSDKKIKWDSNNPINTASWDVKISGNNFSSINSASWDIKISWKNTWSINSASWDVEINESNTWIIKTASWDVELWNNNGNIQTASWDVNVAWENNGSIKTASGDIIMNINNGKITTVTGSITIWETRIKIIKNSIGWTINITGNSISWIITWWDVYIWNWRVIINGVDQSKNNLWNNNNKYQVEVWWVLIDYNEKKYTDLKSSKSYNITTDANTPIRLEWEEIIAIYAQQEIRISQLQVEITKI